MLWNLANSYKCAQPTGRPYQPHPCPFVVGVESWSSESTMRSGEVIISSSIGSHTPSFYLNAASGIRSRLWGTARLMSAPAQGPYPVFNFEYCLCVVKISVGRDWGKLEVVFEYTLQWAMSLFADRKEYSPPVYLQSTSGSRFSVSSEFEFKMSSLSLSCTVIRAGDVLRHILLY